jgi:hypothetical protein
MVLTNHSTFTKNILQKRNFSKDQFYCTITNQVPTLWILVSYRTEYYICYYFWRGFIVSVICFLIIGNSFCINSDTSK